MLVLKWVTATGECATAQQERNNSIGGTRLVPPIRAIISAIIPFPTSCMSKDSIVIVARLKDAKHPAGNRIAGMRRFTENFSVALVTKEQADEIKKDPYLMIATRNSESWLAAFGLEYTEDNQKKYGNTTPPVTTATMAEVVLPAGFTEEATVEKGGIQGTDAVERSEIIAKLEAKGKKEGKDFNKDAPIKTLQSLL